MSRAVHGEQQRHFTMSGTTGVSPIQSYLTDSTNESKLAIASAKASAQETSLIQSFQKNASTITTPAALLKNYPALSVVLGAFNLSGSIHDTALLQKLMTQDPTSKTSLAQKLGNAQYLSFANAMSNWSPPPFSTASGVNAIVTAYQTNQFEATAGAQTPGLQNALYFTRMAGSLTSVTQLQSDPKLLAVAVTGLGLPLSAYDNLSYTQQTALLNNKLKMSDFAKPSYVKHLAELYVVQQQLNAPLTPAAPTAGSMLSLFEGSGSNNSASGLLTILESSTGTTSSLLGTSTSSGSNSNILSLFA